MIIYLRKAIAVILAVIAQQEAMDKNFKPLGEISGSDTAIERSFSRMVTSEREFVQLWREHKEIFGDPGSGAAGVSVEEAQIPKVDFGKNVVIAYFAGQTTGVLGYSVVDVDSKGKTNVVRIQPEVLNTGPGLVNSTFGMWVFPRPKKAVELELIVGFENGKPVTRKVGKFEPPKAAVKQS